MKKRILSLLLAMVMLLSLLPMSVSAADYLPEGSISNDGILTLPEYPDAAYYEIQIGDYLAWVQDDTTFDLNKFCFDNNMETDTYILNVAVCNSEGLTLKNYFDSFTYHAPHKKEGYIAIWSEDFEGADLLPQGWDIQDRDGDGKNWEITPNSNKACHGNNAIASYSWDRNTDLALTPENWLTLPTQVLQAGKKYLFTFQMSTPDSTYKGDRVDVYVRDNSNNQLTKVKSGVEVTDNSYHEIMIDLSAYAGNSITISVVHQNCTDQYAVVLDCFRLWVEHATESVGEIALTGLSKPVGGSKIADNAGVISGTGVIVNQQGWSIGISEKITSEETFRGDDTVYCYFVELYAKEGYEFTTSTVVKFRNDVLPKLIVGANGYYYNKNRMCIFIFSERIEDVSQQIIPSVRIKGLHQPMVGEKLAENQANLAGNGFAATEAAWYNAQEKIPVTASSFGGPKGYYYLIRLTANVGYQFSDTTAVYLQETLLQRESSIAVLLSGDSGYVVGDENMVILLYSEDLPQKIDPCLHFTDIDRNAWYHDAIDYAIASGMMAGMPNNTFAPNGEMTRSQFVQILYNLEGESAVTYKETFTDVKNGSWYAKAVLWAAENGIVSGIGNNRFNPEGAVTREQMATILFQYFGTFKGVDVSARADLKTFPDDNKVSSWAYEALQWANAVGLINGASNGGIVTLAPKGTATRAQAAQVLYNYFVS